MARSEARITVDIWAEESDFTELSADAQWMYMFLISQKDLAHTGVIALRETRWSRAARGLDATTIRARINELEQARYVVVDRGTEELLVRSFIRRDKVYLQPQVLRNAADQLPLIASNLLRIALAVELRRIADMPMSEASSKILAEMREALPEPPAHPPAKGDEHPPPQAARTGPGERGVVTVVTTASPVPRSSGAPDPGTPSGSDARTRARERPGTRIPDDFEPTIEMTDWARQHAPTTSRADHERFVDYWRGIPGAKGRKLDWPATWRNWMRREHEQRASHQARASPTDRVNRGGLVLNRRTAEDLDGRARMQALDEAEAQQHPPEAQRAIGGAA